MKRILEIAITVFPCLSDEVSALHASRCLRADSDSGVWMNWIGSSVTRLCL